ncbi:hypothetical protein NBRC116494_31080 [Aurantivibrio plasticivorans]
MATAIRPTLRGLVAGLFCTVAINPVYADKPLSSVADLRYGVTLYEYYQGNHFEALTELMVAEQHDGIQGHADNPKLIEGGISLAFGMEQKAGNIFTELLKSDGDNLRPLEVRNAAWFYLAKLRYLRADWNGTEASFSKISGDIEEDELTAELEALRISLAIRRNDLDAAQEAMDDADHIRDWRHYLYYNMGNAYSRAQRYDEAQRYYDRLEKLEFSESPVVREEQLVLYDKALTAAGYAHVLAGEPEDAIDEFKQVRLDSRFSNQALLGYGWAEFERGKYSRALRPWQVLEKRALIHPSVQEATIAVPYTYEKMGANGQALLSYLDAEGAFLKEIERIDQVLLDIEQLDLLSALKIEDVDNRNWLLIDEDTGVQPHLTYLVELFSRNEFQASVQELRDLLHIEKQLGLWLDRIDAYDYMLQQREVNREQQLQRLAQRNLREKVEELDKRRAVLKAQMNNIVENNRYFTLAEGLDADNYEIVQSIAANLEKLERAGEPVAEYREMYRRFYGLLYWQASEDFSERKWQIEKRINVIDKGLEQAQKQLERFDSIRSEAPDILPYRNRLADLNIRLDTQALRAIEAVEMAENTLRGAIADELNKQKRRLQHYLSQARLSVARLYDITANPQPLGTDDETDQKASDDSEEQPKADDTVAPAEGDAA